jgi:uncharacterized SAM-binding protein YcdF (DUF218 family)
MLDQFSITGVQGLSSIMFYFISKALWFVCQPSSLIVSALVVSAGLLCLGKTKQGRHWCIGSLGALVVCGFLPLADVLLAPLESRFSRPDQSGLGAGVDGIIVLGGAEDGRINVTRELMSLNDAGERLTEAVALARQFPKARVVFSGGSDAILRTKLPEAQRAQQFLTVLGVDPARITLEDRSRNTHENAVFTAQLLGLQSGRKWLLVTSAFHMPRSIGIFRQIGLDVMPWPVDYRTPTGAALFMPYNSISYGLHRFDFVVKEYIGLAAYWATGRSQSLFPHP